MTLEFRIILILVSVVTLFGIIKKVRNAKVQIENSIFWIAFSTLLLILSIFPQIAVFATDLLGMYSTVNFIFLFVIFVLLIHQFSNSIKISQLENKIKDLTQEIAVRKLVEENEKVNLENGEMKNE